MISIYLYVYNNLYKQVHGVQALNLDLINFAKPAWCQTSLVPNELNPVPEVVHVFTTYMLL